MESLAPPERPFDWARDSNVSSYKEIDRRAALIVASVFLGAALLLFGLVVYNTFA